MNIDIPDRGTGATEPGCRNPEGGATREHLKQLLRVNGMMTNQEATVEPDESQTTMSDHPPEGTVEDVTGWPEWYV
jgi:hypothetical protein